jgi:speckle-type POZ protein
MVVNDRSISVPPSDIVEHLGTLLDSRDGTDVSFIVGNETFHAHRALLGARSPVFKAELLGSMVEAKMASITLHNIAPATFKLMLRFMYTDTFPGDAELGECPSEMIRHLLAAADRYALDRLKLSCARKLLDIVSVDTVAATLACAEMYNCSELKIKCIDFFAMEKNFRKAVLTDGFVQLVGAAVPIHCC